MFVFIFSAKSFLYRRTWNENRAPKSGTDLRHRFVASVSRALDKSDNDDDDNMIAFRDADSTFRSPARAKRQRISDVLVSHVSYGAMSITMAATD